MMESSTRNNSFRVSENSEFNPENDVIHAKQLNCHHAKEATRLFNEWMLEGNKAGKKGNTNILSKLKIGLIQEPYLGNTNSILNFDKTLNVFQHSGRKKTRAGIIATKNLPFWLLTQYTNDDIVSVAIRSNNKIFVFTSVYMDYNFEPPQLVNMLVWF